MSHVPVLKPREVIARLEALGGRDISPVLLRQICKDIGVTIEVFLGA
jgi:predicted RNA binding protein YcfA (HicA-like mRNA interferase family)